jgi:hypothetical protein
MTRRGCMESLFGARQAGDETAHLRAQVEGPVLVSMDSKSEIAADRHCGDLPRVKWR